MQRVGLLEGAAGAGAVVAKGAGAAAGTLGQTFRRSGSFRMPGRRRQQTQPVIRTITAEKVDGGRSSLLGAHTTAANADSSDFEPSAQHTPNSSSLTSPSASPSVPKHTADAEMERKFAAEMERMAIASDAGNQKKAGAIEKPQKFVLGARVYVKRSSGQQTIAFVTEFDGSTGVYTVSLNGPDSTLHKRAYESSMQAAPVAQQYLIGAKVYAKRSHGGESFAWVREFSSVTGIYVVELESEGSELYKNLYEGAIRLVETAQAPTTPSVQTGSMPTAPPSVPASRTPILTPTATAMPAATTPGFSTSGAITPQSQQPSPFTMEQGTPPTRQALQASPFAPQPSPVAAVVPADPFAHTPPPFGAAPPASALDDQQPTVI